jgi:AraC-like DNA-binding protein
VREANIPPTGVDTRVYLLERALIIQARSYSSNRRDRATHLLSAILIVANRNPVRLKLKGMPARDFQGVLLSPRVLRESFDAHESDLTLVDIDVAHPAYLAIEPRLRADPVQALPDTEIRMLQELLSPGHLQPQSCTGIHALFDNIVAVLAHSITGGSAIRDSRVCKTLELIDRLPFNEISLTLLASRSCLSESRLRHLFRREMGCTLSQYIRWAGVRKAMDLWRKDEPLMKGIQKAGFNDSSHFYHAFKQHFSMTPTVMGQVSRNWAVTRCGRYTEDI